MRTILKKVFQSNIQTLNDTLSLATDNYDKALDALLKAKSIHFFGTGDAFSVCQLAFMKFNRLGVSGSAHSDVMLQLIAAANMKQEMWRLQYPTRDVQEISWMQCELQKRWEP